MFIQGFDHNATIRLADGIVTAGVPKLSFGWSGPVQAALLYSPPPMGCFTQLPPFDPSV